MSVKLKPISDIKIRLGIDPNGKVQKFFTETCAKHMDKYVPMDNGGLRRYELGKNYVEYQQPYARYQYKGIREDGSRPINEANRNRTKHPLATSYWDRKMVTAEKQDIINEVQQFINGK